MHMMYQKREGQVVKNIQIPCIEEPKTDFLYAEKNQDGSVYVNVYNKERGKTKFVCLSKKEIKKLIKYLTDCL